MTVLHLLIPPSYEGDIECLDKNSFHCNINSCIPRSKVCDGTRDCDNGIDEVGCGISTIKGINEARENGVLWLKKKRTPSWGWGDNTPRGVVTLYLASDATFDGKNMEEELMAKETEVQTAVGLLKPSFTNSELSMFITALLVTCHNPRKFHGYNLVRRLKDMVEASEEFTHPNAYLALCNAREPWPAKATSDLNSILNSTSESPFLEDLRAMAIIALFGNVYTTAVITQALIASGQEHAKDWKLNTTIKYLMDHMNSSSIDLSSTYLILPLLNGKSLTDISKVDCSANPRKHGDDPVSKVRLQYSLYIGDNKNVVHTIYLKVPDNSTAAEVMKLAEVEDPKYKCKQENMSGRRESNQTESLHRTNLSPEKLTLSNGQHLVFWYKTASL
ncbi:uncharacterized protein CG3556 [Caerostris darwini]|uniref:Uncharacterized protein CG3556 n=1 Tax=Caerostris darwini TaxID=1538125 RepID=A0AAV4NQT5_9ARAC|nr:uncharacterized protein CG3556 [Caerostris darwini]